MQDTENQSLASSVEEDTNDHRMRFEFYIHGMKCQSCVQKVKHQFYQPISEHLSNHEQLTDDSLHQLFSIDVNLSDGKTTITIPKRYAQYISNGQLKNWLQKTGFSVLDPEEIEKDKESTTNENGSYNQQDGTPYSTVSNTKQKSESNFSDACELPVCKTDQDMHEQSSSITIDDQKQSQRDQFKDKAILGIEGMSCASCVSKIERGITSMKGVDKTFVNLLMQKAEIYYDQDVVAREDLVEKVSNLGYDCKDLTDEIYNEKNRLEIKIPTHHLEFFLNLSNQKIENKKELMRGIYQEFDKYHGTPSSTNIYTKFKAFFLSCFLSNSNYNNLVTRDTMTQVDNREHSDMDYDVKSAKDEEYELETSDNLKAIETAFHTIRTGVIEASEEKDSSSRKTAILSIYLDGENFTKRSIFNAYATIASFIVRSQTIQEQNLISIMKPSEQRNKVESIRRKKEVHLWIFHFVFSALFAIPSMLVALLLMQDGIAKQPLSANIRPGFRVFDFVMILLSTPVQIVSGYPYYKLTLKALKGLSLDMNTLIAIATSEAYALSLFIVIYNAVNGDIVIPHHYFETSASLIMFISLGRMLENIAKGKSGDALVSLLNMQPAKATLIPNYQDDAKKNSANQDEQLKEHNLQEQDIDVDLLCHGDIVKVVRGSKIPVDGTLVEVSSNDEALIDEQMITGESLPVRKKIGDELIGGTVSVGDNYFFMRATRVGSESTLSGIVQLVEEAQTSKPKSQNLADRISSVFVPFVISLSIVVFIIWLALDLTRSFPATWKPTQDMSSVVFSLLLSIATVVIACPCSLGLAVPTAVLVGTGMGARHGILIKTGEAIDNLKKANCFLFDKTGTLTEGNLKVQSLELFSSDFSFGDVLYWVGVAESGSEHPIGQALLQYVKQSSNYDEQAFQQKFQQLSNFSASSGKGIQCEIDQHQICIGNRSYIMNEMNHELAKDSEKRANEILDLPHTHVLIGIDGKVVGIASLADEIREEAIQVVDKLQNYYHYDVYMVTGDNDRVARHVAKKIGIREQNIFSEQTPNTKAEKVKQIQQGDKRSVIMVGDGINDSPSLTQSNCGVAIGQGTDVAIESAQIILMNSSLKSLLSCVKLCRLIYWRFIINFIWAFGYNSIALPFAAGVFLPLIKEIVPPWIAGIAMALSSVCVVLSSLALRLHKIDS